MSAPDPTVSERGALLKRLRGYKILAHSDATKKAYESDFRHFAYAAYMIHVQAGYSHQEA